MTKFLQVAVAIVVTAGWGTAPFWQQPAGAPPAGTSVIVGRCLDAQSGAPIAGVVVTIAGPSLTRGTEPAAITDAQGRFALRLLPKGTFTIAASMSSTGFSPNGFIVTGRGFPIGPYLDGGFGQRRPNGPLQPIDLRDGERVDDALIKMWKPGAVAGQVVDEAGEPLVAQPVGVIQISSDDRLLTGPTVKTDDFGRFRIGTLVPGTYVIFVPLTQVSMPVSVGAESASGVADPNLARRFSAAGAPSPTLSGLQIGSTVVSPTAAAADFGGGGGLITGSMLPVRTGDSVFAYPTTFYPSVTSVPAATRIALGSGDERTNLVVRVRPVPSTSVSGLLTDDLGPVSGMGVHLLPGDPTDDASVLEAAVTATDSRGVFVFPTVPAGTYTLVVVRRSAVPAATTGTPPDPPARVAEVPGAWATQSITVSDRPLDGIALRLKQGVSVTGEARFVGSAPLPVSGPDRQTGIGTVSIVRARPLFRAPGPSASGLIEVTANGGVTIRGISPPGRFVVSPGSMSPPWTIESISIGGRDITDTPIKIDGSDLTDLVLTYTDKPAGVGGTVSIPTNNGDVEPSVVLFPADRARWPDARLSARTFRIARASKTRAFTLTNIPPGDYLVAAIADEMAGDWPDASVLAKVALVATPVRVAAAQHIALSLDLKVPR